MHTEFVQRFDTIRNFQYVNDEPSVLHCHHYASLFTKLAIDHSDLNGPRLLADSMEESFYLVLKKYFITNMITAPEDKIRVAEEYFALIGMGSLKVEVNENGGSAALNKSHIDEGWIKKWGVSEKSVNFIGCGYIAAVFSVINGKSLGAYRVKETSSIVTGKSTSRFSVESSEVPS